MAHELTQEKIAKLNQCFHMFDKNGDGFISKTELKDMLVSMGRSPDDGEVRLVLASIDHDCDGTINYGEFLNFFSQFENLWEHSDEPEMKQLFRLFDRDNDGFITYEEIKRALEQDRKQHEDHVTHGEVQQMIDEADTDGDGKLTYEEFEAVMTKVHGPQ